MVLTYTSGRMTVRTPSTPGEPSVRIVEVCLPPLLRYPTVDELGVRAAALVARHPGHARLRRVGTSRAGTPLWLLSVGHGSRQALVVAGPHANEPVGGATVLRLAERALADPRLTEGADATWNLLLCVDPDGLRRNEGWLSGPYTLGRYARNFFRPGFLEQPEWLPHGPTTPRSRRPEPCSRSRTNCALPAVLPARRRRRRRLRRADPRPAGHRPAHRPHRARLGIPRELGAYDTLYWPDLGPAVYRIPPPRRGDLTAAITEAAVESTWCHPERYGTVTAVVEAPMWGVAAVADGSSPADRDGVLRSVSRTLRHDTRRLHRVLAWVRPHLATVPEAAPPRAGRRLPAGLTQARRRVGPRHRRRIGALPAADEHRPPGRPAPRRTAPGPRTRGCCTNW